MFNVSNCKLSKSLAMYLTQCATMKLGMHDSYGDGEIVLVDLTCLSLEAGGFTASAELLCSGLICSGLLITIACDAVCQRHAVGSQRWPVPQLHS